MVLNTRASGWLQLCGGSVKVKEGRGAATLARLLGCSPSGARKVLARLTEAGVVARQHRETSARMRGRARVMLLPVARAYGRTLASVEAVSGPGAVFSQRPDGAVGDHAPAGTAGALGTTGICGAEGPGDAEDQERPDSAELHTDHASVVTPVVSPQLDCGFSGEGRGGEGRRPERMCVREDQAADDADTAAGSTSPVAEDGPLRGEKPKESPADERVEQRAAGAGDGGRPKAEGWEKAQQQRRAGLPDDLRLRVALRPVSWLWERLSGWQQDQVEAAATTELARLEGLLAQWGGAPQLLAGRLTDRLQETGGEALVDKPFSWLIRRGLVQRPSCTDWRCDDGIRLDTRQPCPSCQVTIADRQNLRRRISAAVDEELPHLPVGERRTLILRQLNREYAHQDALAKVRREQHAEETARRDAARAERRQALDEEAARQAAERCVQCGAPQAGGLCGTCSTRREADAVIEESVLIAAAAWADLHDLEDVARVQLETEMHLRAQGQAALNRMLAEHNGQNSHVMAVTAALSESWAVRTAATECRDRALAAIELSPEADDEAGRAYETELRRRVFARAPDAREAASAVAQRARTRAARHLLDQRLAFLRTTAGTRALAQHGTG